MIISINLYCLIIDLVFQDSQDIRINEDTSIGASEAYLKISSDNGINLQSPVVRNVNDGDKINYNWTIVLGLARNTYNININIKDENIGIDGTIGSVKLYCDGNSTDLYSNPTNNLKTTISYKYLKIYSENTPLNNLPGPYKVTENKSFDPLPYIVATTSIIGVVVGVLTLKTKKLIILIKFNLCSLLNRNFNLCSLLNHNFNLCSLLMNA